MPISRRAFLERIAATGGAAAAYDVMTGLGLLAAPQQAPFNLQGSGEGVRVAVLGAGLAGLTVAYELGKLGYRCQVLEARPRAGGRAYTVRRGAASEEDGPSQTCEFDEGLYLNAGAMRIPHHHRTVIQYCRELQVPLEVFAVSNDATFLYQHKAPALAGRRIRVREARTDLDGYVAELLSKAVSQTELNLPLTPEDRERLLEYLRSAGALNEQREYRGSSRRGPDDPLPFADLLASRVGFYLQSDYPYQETMLQVVDGTDRLPAAFAARLRDRITYNAQVREINHTTAGVSLVYLDGRNRTRQLEADYCVCTIPLTVLTLLTTNFSPELQRAIRSVSYAAAGKIGLQFKRRFWEEDDGIYGGATRTDQEIAQIVYPSHGFHGDRGVLIGYYIQGQSARPVGDRAPAERQALALEQGARIHPQYPAEFENAFSVAWHRMTWNRGSWASPSADARQNAYPLLASGERRVYFAGDYLNMNAWMQGAFEAARQVASALHARAMQEIVAR